MLPLPVKPLGSAVPESIELICPNDATRLRRADDGFRCASCAARFPIEAGVVRFLPDRHDFYEGRYLYTVGYVPSRESPARVWPLWLMNDGWVWAVRKHVPERAVVIEMGCGGGVAYFAHRYRVIGLDLSLESLSGISGRYMACVQADAAVTIPLPDASIDAVISSYAWEHIQPDQKPRVLRECARVLRPGGKLIFLYDVECESPLYQRMKQQDLPLYREVLIDREGHLGWQTPEENLAAFEAAGFRVREHRGKEKLFIAPAMFDKVQHWGGGLARLSGFGLRFRGGRAYHLYNAGLRVFDETLGRLLPERWARVMVTVCEKPAAT